MDELIIKKKLLMDWKIPVILLYSINIQALGLILIDFYSYHSLFIDYYI